MEWRLKSIPVETVVTLVVGLAAGVLLTSALDRARQAPPFPPVAGFAGMPGAAMGPGAPSTPWQNPSGAGQGLAAAPEGYAGGYQGPAQALAPSPMGGDSLQSKMQRFQQRVQQLQSQGRDLSSIGGIMKDFPSLVQAGRKQEAEALIDRALDAVEQTPAGQAFGPAGPGALPGSQGSAAIQQKLQRLQQSLPAYMRNGGDPSAVQPLLQKLDGFMRSGKPQDAEPTVDRILAIVERSSGARP